MTHKLRIAAATAAVSITGLSLAACGASSDTNADAVGAQLTSQQTGAPPAGTTGISGATGPAGVPGQTPPGADGAAGAGGPFASLSSDDIKCLKEQGVTVPSGPPAQGTKPGKGNGSSKSGRHSRAHMPTPAAMKKAARACGVDLPEPGTMGGQDGGPGALEGSVS